MTVESAFSKNAGAGKASLLQMIEERGRRDLEIVRESEFI
jgi:hypothetical protein